MRKENEKVKNKREKEKEKKKKRKQNEKMTISPLYFLPLHSLDLYCSAYC